MRKVRWERSATNELAELWLAADSSLRAVITDATHAVDLLLRTDPEHQGESRAGALRVHFVPPLGFLFRVDADGQFVSVIHVWDCTRRRR